MDACTGDIQSYTYWSDAVFGAHHVVALKYCKLVPWQNGKSQYLFDLTKGQEKVYPVEDIGSQCFDMTVKGIASFSTFVCNSDQRVSACRRDGTGKDSGDARLNPRKPIQRRAWKIGRQRLLAYWCALRYFTHIEP